MCSSKAISRLEPVLFLGEQRDVPSVRSGFTSPAKTYLKMRLIMKKSSGIARYVHHPFKNSVEFIFFLEVFSWRLLRFVIY